MIENKTIFIAHKWLDTSLNRQSKEMALYFSGKNKVFFLHAGTTEIPGQEINKNISVIAWPSSRPVGFKDLLFAVNLMQRNKPDIVLSNFAANNIMLFTGWLFGVEKRVCYYHTLVSQYIADKGRLGLKQRLNIFRKNFFWRKATHILASSNSAKRDILKYYNVKEKNIYIFPNALPDKHILNKGDEHRVGFIGRLHKSKGVDILVEAFGRLSLEMPELTLQIAGSGDERAALENSIERLSLKGKVAFVGSLPNEEICNFIAGLNFLVVPSRIDNLPTVVLEAFSTGTPVIASNVGGIPDMVQDSENGLLFDGESVEGLYEKMKQLVADKVLRGRLAIKARETFIERYSLENLPARFEELLA